jgi:hypothetical protein
VTQAHCAVSEEILLSESRAKNVSLKIENGSTKKISIRPVVEVSNFLRGTTDEIQIESGKTIVFDPAAFAVKWGLGKVKITGFTVSLQDDSLEELYVPSKLNGKVRITDVNLRKFFGLNK